MAQRHSIKLVESKRDEHTDLDIVDSKFRTRPLSSIVEHLHYSPPLPSGWAVWLSTTSQSLGTAEWLRLKLSADDSTASTENAALDRIMMPNPDS